MELLETLIPLSHFKQVEATPKAFSQFPFLPFLWIPLLPTCHISSSYACTLLSMFLKIVNLFLIEDELTVFNILEFLCFPKRS